MSITVSSNTEPQANLDAVNSVVGKGKVADKKSVSEESDESAKATEESETSEESEDQVESEESEENEESEDEVKPKKPLKGFKRTIVKKDKEIAALRAELAKKNEAKVDQAVVPKTSDADAEKEPNIDDFATYGEYNRALIKFEARQLIKAEKAEEAKKAAQENLENESKKAQDKFAKQYAEFSKTVDDLEETMDSVSDITLAPVLQAALADSDIAPEILYHLAKNRDELERINELSPVAIAREIGKIEAKLEKAPPKKEVVEKKQTKAPPPVTPIGSKSSSSLKKDINDPNLSQEEYEAIRRKQLAARGR